MNTKLHERVRVIKSSFDATPESISSLNLAAALDNVDPELLNFLLTMTQPVRQSRRNLFENNTTQTDMNTTKNIRLFYALSVLVFCTNNTCSAPLHILLTEAVLCHGGTLELVRILNRLGAVASIDTVNRLATHVVQKRQSEGVKSDLKGAIFSAVSIDNIDILQSYGFVSCLDTTRSWHGTSVQCVQPLPISGHLTSDDKLAPSTTDCTTNKRMCSSPAHTPIPREKHKRRRRTQQPSPHSTSVIPSQEPTPASNSFLDLDSDTILHSAA